jgi:hypothetical protein
MLAARVVMPQCVCTSGLVAAGTGVASQTKRQLKDGIDLGDKALIVAALARADAFKAEWGEIDIPAEQFELARNTLDIIEKEEMALSGIRASLSHNGLHGPVGGLVAKDVDVAGLQAAVHLVQAATVRTKLGNALVTFAKVGIIPFPLCVAQPRAASACF